MLDNVSRFPGSFSRLTSSRSSRSRFSLLSSRNSRTISSLIPSSLTCSASGRAAAFSVPSPLLFRFFSFVLTQFLPQTHPRPLHRAPGVPARFFPPTVCPCFFKLPSQSSLAASLLFSSIQSGFRVLASVSAPTFSPAPLPLPFQLGSFASFRHTLLSFL